MKKRIIAGIILILVIAVIALLYTVSHLGPLIKNAVNTYGPGMTKTDVRLSDVNVSLLSGRASIQNLFIGNPPGFKSREALSVNSVYVDVDEKSLIGSTIIIDRIEVISPRITYETRGSTDNFKTILNNIRSAARSGTTAGTAQAKKKPGKKVLIRDLIIRDGKVTVASTLAGGGRITVSLPDTHLTNVGGNGKGVTPEEAFTAIVSNLYAGITSPSVIGGIDSQLKQAGTGIGSAGRNIQEGVNSVTGALKGVLGN